MEKPVLFTAISCAGTEGINGSCRGGRRATRTKSGSAKSCCNKRASKPSSPTTAAGCARFPRWRPWPAPPASRVLKLWEGLGYYSRARNLHRAAKILVGRTRSASASKPKQRRTAGPALPAIVERLRAPNKTSSPVAAPLPRTTAASRLTRLTGASVPRRLKPAATGLSGALSQLPGIGQYTAAAIASIAFGEAAPLVDGNVARVFARVFGIRSDVTKPATQKLLWALAAELLPIDDPGTFNQALMELGALICAPVRPQCGVCPLNRCCLARANGMQDELPNRGPRPAQRRVVHNVALARRGNRVLLQQRPSKGLLAGMWQLPPLANNRLRSRRPLLTIRHTVTNRRITLRVFESVMPSKKLPSNGRLRWATPKDLTRLAMPAAHRRALEGLVRYPSSPAYCMR